MDRNAARVRRRVVDLNADVGEGDGAISAASDAELITIVTSVNVACGMHAGSPSTMRRTVACALEHRVAVGAHPGLDDREGFGRRERAIAPVEAYELVLYQIGALDAFVRSEGGRMAHVKPHGALYSMAARDPELADAIASAVCDYDDTLAVVGLAGSALVAAAEIRGLGAIGEVFADRRYRSDGHLVARGEQGATIHDPAHAAERVLAMLDGGLPAGEAPDVAIAADTVCLHGDAPGAAVFARELRRRLEIAGVTLAAYRRE